MRRFTIMGLPAVLLVCCGCSTLASSWNSFSPLVDRPVIASAANPVVDVACMWQPGEGRSAKGVPARGFAGQIYFFTKDRAEPVLVKGDVRVYLFAGIGTAEEQARPVHQYDFMAEAWKTHASRTSLGPGYNVFIPYPEHAHYQVRCQLRVRYQPPGGGPPIWSEALSMVLDGPPRPDDAPLTWMTGERQAAGGPENQLTISHQRISADKLKWNGGPEAKMADDPESEMRVDTFNVNELRQAVYGDSQASGPTTNMVRPAEFEQDMPDDAAIDSGSREWVEQHPLSRMSEAEKAAVIRRVLEVGGYENLEVAEPTASENERKSSHPLSDSTKHPLSDSAEHPLSDSGALLGEASSGQINQTLREGEEQAGRSWHPLAIPDDGSSNFNAIREPRRFVAPRPNRAVVMSPEPLTSTRANVWSDDVIENSSMNISEPGTTEGTQFQ